MPPELMSLEHAFESLASYADSSAPFAEDRPSDWCSVWYDPGYVSAWDSPHSSERFLEPARSEDFAEKLADAEEKDLLHGAEAASWANLSKRALLRRMEED